MLRDRDALRNLHDKLASAQLDLHDAKRQTFEALEGKKDAQRRAELLGAIEPTERTLVTARKAGGVTLAVAADTLASSKMALDALGHKVNPDDILALAEEAHRAAPSRATESALHGALLYRARHTLSKSDAAFADLATRCRRSLGASYLIAAVLSGNDVMRQKCLANPDVQRAQKMLTDSLARYPDTSDEWTWAMLRFTHAAEAGQIAKEAADDEVNRLQRQVAVKLAPYSAGTAYRQYWALQMAGDETRASEALGAVAAHGVPLPFEPKVK